ncbi:MAG: hypothetical protein V1874_11385 [Spirochaetota bacterium]
MSNLFNSIVLLLLIYYGCDKSNYNLLNKTLIENVNSNSLFSISSERFSGGRMENEISADKLAHYWAPVHYQAFEEAGSDCARPDFITRIDRDLPGRSGGLWDLAENWDKGLSYPLRAYVYYSVVVSESHFFITYSFYHPWDTEVLGFNETGSGIFLRARVDWNRNDMEGVLFVVKRNGSYGTLDCVFTQGHGYLHTYFPMGSQDFFFAKGEGSRRRRPFPLQFIDIGDGIPRVKTSQEAGGHGAGCLPDWGSPSPGRPDYNIYKQGRPTAGTGKYIVYYPGKKPAEEPDIKSKRICRYNLIDIFDPEHGLWKQRGNVKIFEEHSASFIGDHSCAPWSWRGDKETVNESDIPGFLKHFNKLCNTCTGMTLIEIANNGAGRLNLVYAEKNMVVKDKQPWTHRPADLCRVYIRNLNPGMEPVSYFSNKYSVNKYLADDIKICIRKDKN